jgi:hypothetical protein
MLDPKDQSRRYRPNRQYRALDCFTPNIPYFLSILRYSSHIPQPTHSPTLRCVYSIQHIPVCSL